jgi:lipopolysaccharide export system protein LptA
MMRVVAFTALAALLTLPAAAQLSRPGANRNQPIEINADKLEVQQEKQIAIFTGNVDATQGDMRMKADQLRVYYREQAQQPPSRASGQRPAGPQRTAPARQAEPSVGGAISRIEAFGKVFLSSPTETGSGDTGVYDVDKQTFTLEGQKVVLTRGRNVLNCKHVVTNLETGVSTCDAPAATGGGRVQGVFVPEQKSN